MADGLKSSEGLAPDPALAGALATGEPLALTEPARESPMKKGAAGHVITINRPEPLRAAAPEPAQVVAVSPQVEPAAAPIVAEVAPFPQPVESLSAAEQTIEAINQVKSVTRSPDGQLVVGGSLFAAKEINGKGFVFPISVPEIERDPEHNKELSSDDFRQQLHELRAMLETEAEEAAVGLDQLEKLQPQLFEAIVAQSPTVEPSIKAEPEQAAVESEGGFQLSEKTRSAQAEVRAHGHGALSELQSEARRLTNGIVDASGGADEVKTVVRQIHAGHSKAQSEIRAIDQELSRDSSQVDRETGREVNKLKLVPDLRLVEQDGAKENDLLHRSFSFLGELMSDQERKAA